MHKASVSGLARTQTYGSINCVNASSPLVAVGSGGSVSVSAGSTSATRGRRCGLRRLALQRWAGEASTALRVTSAPVPAVVGMAIQGADGRPSGAPRPMISR